MSWILRRVHGCGSLAAAVLLAAAFSAAGCSSGGPTPRSAGPVTLNVAVASDLQAVFPTLIGRFRETAPGVKVTPIFGASGQLTQQIKAGAPVDLFLSANEKFLRDLSAENLVVAETIRPYAIGALVVAFRADSGLSIGSLNDLRRPEVKKIAIANPDLAPYGAAARSALKNAGLWDELTPRIVIAESIRQAFTYVESGDAEVGLVGRALAVRSKTVRSVEVDPSLYEPIVQSLGVVARSEHAEAARSFAAFLTGEAGRAILQADGFKLPEERGRPDGGL